MDRLGNRLDDRLHRGAFLTSWPINRWLLQRGIKDPMPTA
jgi:hypothetical protein